MNYSKKPTDPERATKAQIKFIELLADKLKLDRVRRNAHASSIVGRKIKALDELYKNEASLVIGKMKFWAEPPASVPNEED